MKKLVSLKKPLAVAAATMALSAPAMAEVSGSFDLASMYLWRGQDLSSSNAAISGSLDYSHESGAYAGIWTSSEGATGTHEVDYYLGFAGEAGNIGYDLAYVSYQYPEQRDEDYEEIYLGLSFGDIALDSYFGTGETGHGTDYTTWGDCSNGTFKKQNTSTCSGFGANILAPVADPNDNENNYYALSYNYDKLTFVLGMTDNEISDTDYSHLDISYAINDNLTFTASKVIDADKCALGANEDSVVYTGINSPVCDLAAAVNVDPTLIAKDSNVPDDVKYQVSYSFSF